MPTLKICLLDRRIEKRHIERVLDVSPEVEILLPGGYDAQDERSHRASLLSQAQVIFGNPTTLELECAASLRWLHLVSAGIDGYAGLQVLRTRGVTVTNSRGSYGIPIAEHVMALMLSLARKIPEIVLHQEEKAWLRPTGLSELYGKTVGILGLGDIGVEVARRAHAFGMRVVAMKRRPGSKPIFVDELHSPEGIDKVVRAADVLVLCLPVTPSTTGMLSATRIDQMKVGAWVINVGRGRLIDEDALVQALASGRLGGAALDVFVDEPLDRTSPFWTMENVIVSPHTAGASPHLIDRSINLFCRDLDRFLRNERLEGIVDLEMGY